MKLLPIISLCTAICLSGSYAKDKPEAAPGGKEPVVFWAHFMPQVTDTAMHYSFHGNNDAWPLNSQSASRVEGYKEHMRMALESGVNGFQMLAVAPDEVLEAARQIREETGTLFYIAPEWCNDSNGSPTKDKKKEVRNAGAVWAEIVAKYAEQQKDNPAIFRHNGRPLFFTYESGKWEKTPDEIAAFNARLTELNCNALLAPTVSMKMLLDRRDLGDYGAWPDGPIQPGPLQFLRLGFDGGTVWDMKPDSRAVEAVAKRVRQENPGYLAIPAVAAGYDNSNRPSQATRVPYNGIRTLLETVRVLLDGPAQWKTPPFRQFSLITWNDCNESMFVPSSSNVWGFNTILRYFRGMVESKASPFSEAKVVVAYPKECLYGDTLDFQVLALPAKGETVSVRAKLEWEPVGGGKTITLRGKAASGEPDKEVFFQLDWPSGPALGKYDAFQPYLTVELKRSGSKWKTAHRRLRLPPVQLSYNLVQFPTGYAVDLSKVSPSPLTLAVTDEDGLARASVTSKGTSPIRRLHLERGSRSLGVFRESPIGNGGTDGLIKDLFLRIESSDDLPLKLRLSKGTIHNLFTRQDDLSLGVTPVEKETSATFSGFVNGRPFWLISGWRAARIDLERGGAVTLSVDGAPEAAITATLPELLHGRKVKTFDYKGRKATVALGLTFDGTDANVDYPLPAAGEFTRHLPLWQEREGVQVIHAAALLKSGQMAYSNAAVAVGGSAASKEEVPVQWIETKGTFDDFVRDGYAESANPFTPGQVHTALLPRSRVPYFHLDFEEGAGYRLNDWNVEHLAGRAWLENGKGASHAAGYDPESNGNYQWLAEGYKGKALRLGEGERIRFRSKGSPVGPQTTSLWVGMSESGGRWAQLNAGPFTLKKDEGTDFKTTFRRAGCELSFAGDAEWRPGWNHVVFVYDLASVRVYVNGKLAGEKTGVPPVYQRTHMVPNISFEAGRSQALFFDGRIDETEVIGTGLDAAAVEKLGNGAPWRPVFIREVAP